MATLPTTSKISASADEEKRTDYETNLSAENTDDEFHTDTSTWSTANIESDDHLPAVPEENFTQKREVTVHSYSESISSNDDDSSDERTVTADSNSFATPAFEEIPCKWETNTKGN